MTCLAFTSPATRICSESFAPEFESHALRKDYPLKGRGERHNFPVITRAES